MHLDYGEDSLSEITHEFFYEQQSNSSGYSPFLILEHFVKQTDLKETTESDSQMVYSSTLHESTVKLYINKSTFLIDQITFLSHDELYGDVLNTYTYSNYKDVQSYFLAQKIDISKINGQIKDHVQLTDIKLIASYNLPISIPENYQIKEKEDPKSEAIITHYNDHIHFIELTHADNKTLVVEFNDFLCIAKAPLNSENGELILSKAQEIAPNKPIKYFVVGHHHPYSIGGIRPFVNTGAEIICNTENQDYIQYIVEAPRTLEPDALHESQKAAQYRLVTDSLTITDGTYEFQIFNIGGESEHTKDFMMYYFPIEHLLYEDDLAWISKDAPIKKAGKRQAGLYQAIVSRELNVDTIFQSWPISEYNVKSIFPFKELEASIQLK
jgi:glyoxylase-like metal-dependent hydrolase (beta-lactamase superfamily II)